MAILTAQEYQLRSGETPEQYNVRIGQLRSDTPESLANIQSLTKQALKEPSILSTSSAIGDVNKMNERLNELSGTPPREGDVVPGKGTLLPDGTYFQSDKPEEPQESKGQFSLEEVLQLPGIGNDLTGVQLMKDGKYSLDSSALSRLGLKTGASDEGNKELKQAENEFNSLKTQLAQFNVSDYQLQNQINSITATWDARIKEMQNVNERRKRSIETLGVRIGSRYTGGAGGEFGGIISEEERNGVARISSLEAEKQGAIQKARDAARDQNWSVFQKSVSLAETAYKNKVEEVKELNKLTLENNKILEDKRKEVRTEVNKILVDLGKNNAPSDVIASVSSAESVADAVALAGEYLTSGSGIVGEYLFYKGDAQNRGIAPVDFDSFQNQDANRKKSIAQAGIAGTDLDTKQQAVFNRIVDKYNASPAIQALSRANVLKNLADQAEKDPSNAVNQLALIYSYIKGLDTESAVREGEITLVQSIQSYLSKWQTSLEKVASGKVISTDATKQIASGAKTIIKAIEDTARQKEASFKAQARTNGTQVFSAWNDFQQGVKEFQDTGTSLIESEEEADNQLKTFTANNPDKIGEIDSKIKEMEAQLGRSINSSEFLQAFPEYQ